MTFGRAVVDINLDNFPVQDVMKLMGVGKPDIEIFRWLNENALGAWTYYTAVVDEEEYAIKEFINPDTNMPSYELRLVFEHRHDAIRFMLTWM